MGFDPAEGGIRIHHTCVGPQPPHRDDRVGGAGGFADDGVGFVF